MILPFLLLGVCLADMLFPVVKKDPSGDPDGPPY